ncbi:CYTH domain-containing protein [Bacillus inaquosorum]|uniref:Adenylate cyclase n=1 Tax=Bacillus inaquosorum KCTC 13429 TaxID=1236548 RepID=A0A9W5LHT3_9BACI|nr:CYTH domain-containing protein [Bacillus inaquosorum]AWM16486.1 CYTH domain-containing protein [Bacillus inaquosorum]ELS61013.1 adenylate cyclase [Bacillus inaquosorum KCTC 13429]MCY8139341.1 CYTH domain-containing protein [Bacillus inaquosorum]MCY8275511.1 CYTH domain-containing protein [Bacillus inaquosorum]MCY8386055.1 CYTH domain-containing protein [Bacillus inaquosorum]
MSQEIEIEFKNMLTKHEFEKLTMALQLTEKDFTDQKNHYFDTDSFALKQKHAALRIRRKNGEYILTLKEPAEVGLLETHQRLSEVSNLAGFTVPEGPVKDQLHKLQIDSDAIQYFGSLATNRAEKETEKGLIVLDHSRYLNKEDYEIEFEAADWHEGKQAFEKLLHQFSIPQRETKNKILRFYEEKRKSI